MLKKSRTSLETKYLPLSGVEVQVDQRIIQGYFSKFSPDPIGDLTRKGSFAKTIQERGPRSTERGLRSKIKIGFNHGEVIGIPVMIREDDTGAYYEAKIDPTPLGDIILTRIDSGSLDACSFEYEVMKASYPKDDKSVSRVLEEVKLYELGPVDYPMHEDAEITGRKSRKCIGQLCDELLFLLHKKNENFSEFLELKALKDRLDEVYGELTERLEVAVEETLPQVKSQPNGLLILEKLQKLNNTLGERNV
jgi:HK97 family phage prohead protease